MQLPIDVKKLLDETTNVEAARNTPIAVSVLIDDAAPTDLIAHVRSAFASELPTVRLSLAYRGAAFPPRPTDDVAIIVAGASEWVGSDAAAWRAVGVPVMVVTTMPLIVANLAAEAGCAIPEGDLVAPIGADPVDADEAKQALYAEPYELTDELTAALDVRMGRWIVQACEEKKLAFALAFPFVRKPIASDIVLTTALQNAGIGLIPFVNKADMPIMTLNQAKMVLQIAAAYNMEVGAKDRIKEIAVVIGNALLCRKFARWLVGLVPVVGMIAKPGIGFAATTAVGYAMIDYFEGGGDVAGATNVVSNLRDKASAAVDTVRGIVAR